MTKTFPELVMELVANGGVSDAEIESAENALIAKKRSADDDLGGPPGKKIKFDWVDVMMLSLQQKILLAKNLGIEASINPLLSEFIPLILGKYKDDITASLDHCYSDLCESFILDKHSTRMGVFICRVGAFGLL